MKLSFVAKFDPRDVHKRSGTPYYMCQALEQSGVSLDYICSLKTKYEFGFKLKRAWQKQFTENYDSARSNTYTVKHYAKQVEQHLKNSQTNAVLTHILDPVAYLETSRPIILWTDTTYGGLAGFNPGVAYHSARTIKEITQMTEEFFKRCSLAIFSSEWGARGAIELYGASKEKVKVVPFGANLPCNNTLADIQKIIHNRSKEIIKLLFIGKDWELKNGELVFKVAEELHHSGHAVEVHFVGCQPPAGTKIPAYIRCYGFISKNSPAGLAIILQLLQECHFLFVPSRSEAFGIVFCEANAFGMPCLTSYVGGIPVKDNVNGMTFSLSNSSSQISNCIIHLMENYREYEALAISSFHEYEKNLNWKVNVEKVKKLIEESGVPAPP